MKYPEDFISLTGFEIKSVHDLFVCPISGIRIMRENGVPDHDVLLSNPNIPCAHNYWYQVPLEPLFGSSICETSPSGIIGFAMNGVPLFGAQESGGSSAVELLGNFVAVEWYGHPSAKRN